MINFMNEGDVLEPFAAPTKKPRIFGRGGGKSGKGASNDANTLRSRARFNLIEAISEGPIEGLVNGEQSIYFDQTPLLNFDGTYNFKEVIVSDHKGTPDEGYFNGHNAVETPFQVEVQVKASLGPTQRTIVDENADAVRLIMRVPSLVRQDDKGGLKKTSLSYAVDVRSYNGTWNEVLVNTLSNEKALSPSQISHRVTLPLGGQPWDVRVRRLTPDSTDDKLQNDLYWEGYVILVEGKFSYPNTAAIAMEGNAEEMGSNIPPRSYHVKGLKVNVPSNYNPLTRAYTGIWDGTWKIAWTNNPAWVFYDLLINDRYGLGEFIKPEIVDKWSLYTIAQYCDQLVKSGYKNGDTGEDIWEPRFTFNGAINTKDEAFFVLQNITKAWRGMGYWALGQVFATADMPADPIKLVGPANVIGGEFEYGGTAEKARHSVIMVKWNNPDDFYRSDTEVVIDTELLHKKGWRDKSLQLQGCTSRGLAHRYGKWVIDTEQHETDTLTYSASWDHAELKPGDLVAISDPRKANIRAHGRVASHKGLTVELDAPFEYNVGETYQLMLTMPDGSIETKPILAFLDDQTVRLASGFSMESVPDATWTIKGTDITPRLFRVLSVDETEQNIFKVTALFHDPQKFARVEDGISFEPLPYERPSKVALPPTNLLVRETGYISGGQQYNSLTISWTAPQNFLARGFVVAVDTPSGDSFTVSTTNESFMELLTTEGGTYKFYVQTVGMTGLTSEPATIEYAAAGPEGYTLPEVIDLELSDGSGGTEFTGRDLKVRWKNMFAVTANGAVENVSSPHYSHNTVSVYHGVTGVLLRTDRVLNDAYVYDFATNDADNKRLGYANAARNVRIEVTVSDVFGRTSTAISKAFLNPVPAAFNPLYVVAGSQIHFSWPAQLDADFAGVLLWVETEENFDPYATAPKFDGTGSWFSFVGEQLTNYFVRIAAYDAFGKVDLNISPVLQVATRSNFDMDAPDVPTGLAVTSSSDDAQQARVVATWDASTATDLAGYEIQIKEGSGNWIGFTTSATIHDWTVKPGTALSFRVLAFDALANRSEFSEVVEHVANRDTVAPAIPENLTAVGLFRSAWVDFDNVADLDISHYVVETTKDAEVTLYQVAAPAFIHSNLTIGDEWSYRVKAVDTSGNESEYSEAKTATIGALTAGDLPPDALITTFALIDDAFIESAHIVELDASRLKSGSVITGDVKVTTAAGNVDISNPAAIVNAGETSIEPGRVRIGLGSLSSWTKGGDETRIDGAMLSTGTVRGNAMVIGSRNVTLNGIQFEHNSPTINYVSWTAGSISYVNDAGNGVSVAIAAGNAAWTGGTLYVFWSKDSATLGVTTNPMLAFADNSLVVATYQGGLDLNATYGRTVIDGGNIKADSVSAVQMKANSIATAHLQADAVKAQHIDVDSLSAVSARMGNVDISEAYIGTLTVGTSNIKFGACTGFAAARADAAMGLSVGAWNNLAQAAVDVPDYNSSVQVLGSFHVPMFTDFSESPPAGIGGTVLILRDGAEIYRTPVYMPCLSSTSSIQGGNDNGTRMYNSKYSGSFNITMTDIGVGIGAKTYALIYVPSGAPNGLGNSMSAAYRNITTTVFKR